ncbi:hypothetical protein [Lelliottia nimipressuralis]|jgi:hypothetical protein
MNWKPRSPYAFIVLGGNVNGRYLNSSGAEYLVTLYWERGATTAALDLPQDQIQPLVSNVDAWPAKAILAAHV